MATIAAKVSTENGLIRTLGKPHWMCLLVQRTIGHKRSYLARVAIPEFEQLRTEISGLEISQAALWGHTPVPLRGPAENLAAPEAGQCRPVPLDLVDTEVRRPLRAAERIRLEPSVQVFLGYV